MILKNTKKPNDNILLHAILQPPAFNIHYLFRKSILAILLNRRKNFSYTDDSMLITDSLKKLWRTELFYIGLPTTKSTSISKKQSKKDKSGDHFCIALDLTCKKMFLLLKSMS